MTEQTYKPVNKRNEALRKAGKNRTHNAIKKAEKGLRQLLKDGGQISFSSVARTGGVSTKFLHQNEELAERIRYLAAQQKIPSAHYRESELTGESAIIAALRHQLTDQDTRHKKQIQELKERIRDLEEQNQILYGHLTKITTGK